MTENDGSLRPLVAEKNIELITKASDAELSGNFQCNKKKNLSHIFALK